MFIQNSDGLVNGSRGVVIGFANIKPSKATHPHIYSGINKDSWKKVNTRDYAF